MRGRNDIFASVRGESAQPVEEHQIAAGQLGRPRGFGAVGSGRRQGRYGHFHLAPTVELVLQRPPAIGDDGASHRLEQNAVFLRYLVRRSYENAAWPIYLAGFDPCGNESHDLVVEKLPVTGVIFVPDHQVHRQSF